MKYEKKEENELIAELESAYQKMDELETHESDLHESEVRYRRLFEAAQDAILILNSETGIIEDANPFIIDLLGYRREEIVGKKLWEIGAFVDSQASKTAFQELQQKEYIRYENLPLQKKTGELINVEFVSNVYPVDNHKVIQCNIRDITERKRSEEALRESNSFNEMLIQTMPFGMDIVDDQGTILFISDTMKKLIGADALGQFCWSMYKDDKKQCQDCPIRKGLKFGKSEDIEVNNVLNGRTFRISHIGMMYHGRKALLEIFQDITEQKRLQGELLQSHKMESIGTLAGGIAHDFNNILAIILGYTTLLEKRPLDPQRLTDGLVVISQAVERGASLVRQILTFARKTDIVFEQICIADLIHELISMLKQTIVKTITFTEIIETDVQYIFADRTQINQAIMNLCVNARDAMPGGGSITIKVEKQTKKQVGEKFPNADQDMYVCISVADTGEGMDNATRLRIFDPFFTTKEQPKGTGLGLAVVYGVVHLHHGFIDVKSELGHGTIFRLYLPVHPMIEQVKDVPTATESFIAGGTETILIVEDEEPLIDTMSLLLSSKGYKVLVARDGVEATEVYKKNLQEIALVLTDMGLPLITGTEEFRKLKEIDPNVKVVLASGFFEKDIKSELYKAGVKGFIQKPYPPDEILQIIRDVLDAK